MAQTLTSVAVYVYLANHALLFCRPRAPFYLLLFAPKSPLQSPQHFYGCVNAPIVHQQFRLQIKCNLTPALYASKLSREVGYSPARVVNLT